MSERRRKRLRKEENTNISLNNEEDEPMDAFVENWGDDVPDVEMPTFDERRRDEILKENQHHECGIIEKVSLFNFMCHEKFEVDFGPNINFVQGGNGTGKSAILTAIVLVLGGRASTTSRGQNLKSFIKTGQTRAKIVIKLCNDNGYDRNASYKFDTYGKSIIVERNLNIEGGSNYCLKSSVNKVITNKKEELDDIIRHFNIQIANPVCVLNQELSRNFLNSKNPSDKYIFFMKATQLEQLKINYATAEVGLTFVFVIITFLCAEKEQNEKAQRFLQEKKDIFPLVAKELEELKEKINRYNRIVDSRSTLEQLKNEALWATVIEQEKEIKNLENAIEERRSQILQIEVRISQLQEKVEKLQSEEKNLSDELIGVHRECEGIKAMVEAEKKKIAHLKQQKQSINKEITNYRSEINTAKINKEILEKKIADLTNQLCNEAQLQFDRKKRLQKIEEYEKKRKEAVEIERNLQNTRLENQSKLNCLNESLKNIRNDINHFSSQKTRLEQEIAALEISRSDKLRRFGRFVPELVKRIDEEFRNNKFKKKPLGPIGAFINLTIPEAALAVETCLKNLSSAFCCDNMEDEKELRSLMQQVLRDKKFPIIITRKFARRHDVKSKKVVSQNYHSFVDIIQVKEDPIMNVLIDRALIETILYIPDYNECTELLSNIDTVPHNCRQAFTENGTNMYPATTTSSFRSYPPDQKYQRSRYLEGNIDDQIADMKHAIKGLLETRNKRQREEESLSQQIRMIENEMKDFDANLIKTRKELKDVNTALTELKNFEEPSSAEITTLEEELSSFSAKLEELYSLLSEAESQSKNLDEEIRKNNENCIIGEQQWNEHLNKRNPIRQKLNSFKEQLSNSNKELEKCMQILEEKKRKQEECETTLKTLKKHLTDMDKKARSLCQRIETSKTRRQLETEINEITRFMDERISELGNAEEFRNQFKEKRRAFRETSNAIRALDQYLAKFKESMKERTKAYVELRSFICYHTSLMFDFVLDQVNFKGRICFYHKDKLDEETQKMHKAKTIEIKVNPKVNHQSESCNDTRSLSGGERAYSTVGFILALWESCQAPFRILDEFDCFMDLVTRRIAMDTFIETIKSRGLGKQYIFLTPLSLDQYDGDSNLITVIGMPNVEHGIENTRSNSP
ncbi:structural maintenance of chromosomes protein 6-like isoform X2 [Dinothrombium tinctorium]|uniref:Structural maintenance of chromosomes protein 6-like isoform X2 n=1 Tax=Dinothrombium tinctorium TaxID=1965070 RepID=A0A3S3PGQ8_9ACAR|nr:structural maintenance of chromosomes protein 6-like isoform X2 [Dinothrombium tinctorium]RWS14918.1 structural maintenance of chromosomes protein 6-like isoform X2 [Dinothrombium tinctorium]